MLLALNHQIRILEHDLTVARRRSRQANWAFGLWAPLLVLLYAWWWLPGSPRNIKLIVAAPIVILAVWLVVASYMLKRNPGGPAKQKEDGTYFKVKDWKVRTRERDLELALAEKRDARRNLIANQNLDTKIRRITYKEDAYADIDGLRAESNRYRRTHNALQGVLIIGSLAATGASGVATEMGAMRWVILGVTFVVGISSGFMGYFKYKERSFYLQQTADAIEQEWEAVEVGVGRYKHIKTEDERLEEFVAEVHRLKSEQKKRQQNLEQPAEARNPNE
ncbi:hypothetical protein Afil01_25570 [Actinorhabdospora filicis]|uniref:DUF4231 domain-containing protein n=1 Tax=Actinorhabdospora filicis TaxID=1785913 RepID=A0A9W6WAK9_9ACTN|nr:SLATT domain-containing protein [Actinorhabdospora filicis]GLZ77750.1 hypothetical protein Afil01_25570 [Actinorhabdospora filicis]